MAAAVALDANGIIVAIRLSNSLFFLEGTTTKSPG
jgi:hypothetical protein